MVVDREGDRASHNVVTRDDWLEAGFAVLFAVAAASSLRKLRPSEFAVQ